MCGRKLALLLALIISSVQQVAAAEKCSAALKLTKVYDNYFQVLTQQGDLRARAAAKLFTFIPEINALALANEMETEIDPERLQRVLGAAQQLSEYIATGIEVSMVGLAPHTANVQWLGKTIEQTGCLEEFAAHSGPIAVKQRAAAPPPQDFRPAPPPRRLAEQKSNHRYTLMLLAIGVGVGIAGGLGYLLVKSRKFRNHRVQRMPRHLTTFPVVATYVGEENAKISKSVTAHDISAGGMKIAWESPPQKGAAIRLSLPIGDVSAVIAWSNPFFAGAIFDKNLSAADVELLSQTR